MQSDTMLDDCFHTLTRQDYGANRVPYPNVRVNTTCLKDI